MDKLDGIWAFMGIKKRPVNCLQAALNNALVKLTCWLRLVMLPQVLKPRCCQTRQ